MLIVCYTKHSLYLCVGTIQFGLLQICVGFGVARFTEFGNAKASECRTSDCTDSRAFSFLIHNNYLFGESTKNKAFAGLLLYNKCLNE